MLEHYPKTSIFEHENRLPVSPLSRLILRLGTPSAILPLPLWILRRCRFGKSRRILPRVLKQRPNRTLAHHGLTGSASFRTWPKCICSAGDQTKIHPRHCQPILIICGGVGRMRIRLETRNGAVPRRENIANRFMPKVFKCLSLSANRTKASTRLT